MEPLYRLQPCTECVAIVATEEASSWLRPGHDPWLDLHTLLQNIPANTASSRLFKILTQNNLEAQYWTFTCGQ